MAKNKKQNTTQNNITYNGEVTVSVVKGKKVLSTKKIKNNGTNTLFKTICSCLIGNFAQSSIPNFLDGGSRSGSSAITTNLKQMVALTGKNIKEIDDKWYAVFTAYVSHSNIVTESVGVSRIGLYPTQGSTAQLAYIDFGDKYTSGTFKSTTTFVANEDKTLGDGETVTITDDNGTYTYTQGDTIITTFNYGTALTTKTLSANNSVTAKYTIIINSGEGLIIEWRMNIDNK